MTMYDLDINQVGNRKKLSGCIVPSILLIVICAVLFSLKVCAQRDTFKIVMLTSRLQSIQISNGYDVVELKNTIQQDSPTVLCCTDYWEHVIYLDENKIQLSPEIIVWGTKKRFWIPGLITMRK